MPGKRYGAQEIINKLREAEVLLASGQSLQQACRRIGVSKQTLIGGVRIPKLAPKKHDSITQKLITIEQTSG